jgi:HEAT repeat protein
LRSTSNDVLAELLDHPDWTVRVTAALELGQRGDRRANDTLIAAFREAESHTSDVEMLVWLGLVPEWMSPESLGYNEAKINRRYYELVDQYSHPK